MANAFNITDTIAAISTPPGKGGVAVIRISGDKAKDILSAVFRPISKKTPQNAPRMQIRGEVVKNGRVIDDGLATLFPAPNSYTGEDVCEISVHGGMLITASVLEAVIYAGARQATQGEFTKRAYINGKLTLSDAEGIGLLLDAETEGQIKLSKSDSRERLKKRVEEIKSSLISLLSSIYARIDYPDEDLGDFTDSECIKSLTAIKKDLGDLLSTYKTGKTVVEGIKTALIGKPNAGKSTLYNLLLGEDAAIVTDIPGTTRDVLESKVALGDILLRLYDTAGIRDGEVDPVEKIGIERSKKKAETAELVFALFDGSCPFNDEDEKILEIAKSSSAKVIALITKCDNASCDTEQIKEKLQKDFDVIEISAKSAPEETLRTIQNKVTSEFLEEGITLGEDPIISSTTQFASLTRAKESIDFALSSFEMGHPQDLVSSDLEAALEAISELDGRGVNECIVAEIFSKFCVGK